MKCYYEMALNWVYYVEKLNVLRRKTVCVESRVEALNRVFNQTDWLSSVPLFYMNSNDQIPKSCKTARILS